MERKGLKVDLSESPEVDRVDTAAVAAPPRKRAKKKKGRSAGDAAETEVVEEAVTTEPKK